MEENGHSQSITSNTPKAQIDTLDRTLAERALLDCFSKNPHIKQQEAAAQIGKSIATIKRLTAGLIAKGIIERRNGKRNGFWERIR